MKYRRLFFLAIPLALISALFILKFSADNFVSKAGCPCFDVKQATGEFDSKETTAFYNNSPIPLLAMLSTISKEEQQVLGEQSDQEKWIEVDLSEQKLKAWEGNNLFLETLVSTGKWAPTPTGEFRIWAKFKYTKMSGGKKENNTYYYLPNVPYVMYFHQGFGLHGTYWHNNFGTPMSYGCVNLPTSIAEKLYYWTTPTVPTGKNSIISSTDNLGTRVLIHQ